MDDSGQGQEFRANVRASALGGIYVHAETHFFGFQVKLYSSSAFGEAFAFSDHQGVRGFQRIEGGGKILVCGTADKNDLTRFQVREALDVANQERAIVD